MICWKCGHPSVFHKYYDPSGKSFGCQECFRVRVNRNKFYKHAFESNLDYVERKAKEKKLVSDSH